jgi:hypothetical protein
MLVVNPSGVMASSSQAGPEPHHEKRGVQSWDPAAHIRVAVSRGSSLRAAGVRGRRRLRRVLVAINRRLPAQVASAVRGTQRRLRG